MSPTQSRPERKRGDKTGERGLKKSKGQGKGGKGHVTKKVGMGELFTWSDGKWFWRYCDLTRRPVGEFEHN